MGLAPTTRTRLIATAVLLPLAAASTFLLAGAASAQATADVAATGTVFDPATVEVAVGGTVTWTNKDGFHTVTGGEGPEDPASPIGNNPLTSPGATVKITFDKPGTYPYFCEPHLSVGMKGEVVVKAAGGAAAAPSAGATASPKAGATASGAPRPDAAPSDADPAKVDPGALQASESSGPGGENEPEAGVVPGSSAEDNPTLHEIEAQRAANEGKLGGFDALLAAGTLATIAICVAIFASTRPRRSSQ
ncbi:MAG TPA: plastocyanin/azurin family copper-binding protein [Mycobacteriales bacterium]|nr:plastocyanin/azurin family copper-binding protein [Mycobacteriales bacterium]